jgi:hypothetical protein
MPLPLGKERLHNIYSLSDKQIYNIFNLNNDKIIKFKKEIQDIDVNTDKIMLNKINFFINNLEPNENLFENVLNYNDNKNLNKKIYNIFEGEQNFRKLDRNELQELYNFHISPFYLKNCNHPTICSSMIKLLKKLFDYAFALHQKI